MGRRRRTQTEEKRGELQLFASCRVRKEEERSPGERSGGGKGVRGRTKRGKGAGVVLQRGKVGQDSRSRKKAKSLREKYCKNWLPQGRMTLGKGRERHSHGRRGRGPPYNPIFAPSLGDYLVRPRGSQSRREWAGKRRGENEERKVTDLIAKGPSNSRNNKKRVQ